MTRFNPNLHQRHSIRLRGYDYSKEGAYFITICTQNRECLFGEIVDGRMVLNEAGRMIQSVWDELPQHYPGVDIDAFMVMPNHIHGIIFLNVGAGPRACPESGSYANPTNGQPQGVAPTISLPDIVHHFKTLTTTRYRHGVTHNNWASFPGKLWQRNYYEHIIRNEMELNEIREYILNNSAQWALDIENPDSIAT
jgi:REP element-mobilizing transposase RayT